MSKQKEINVEFWELLILCFRYKLNVKQTKYILWHYACNEPYRRIVELEGNRVSYQSIEQMIYRAQEKIKSLTLKNQNQ